MSLFRQQSFLFLSWALLVLAAAEEVSQPGFVGGWRDRSVSDPEVMKAAAFAVQAYNEASNSRMYFKGQRILEAKSQVVAGIKYFLTVEMVSTMCEKKGGSGLEKVDLDHCKMPPEGEQKKQVCNFQVWSRPWLQDTQLLHMSCSEMTS
ncbi:cystatin [Anolis carolinensis]|uniref:cystatin n=1 Tax=Anolis carolinensis TaxID=28377 RepID=UPI002F2B4D68